MEIFVANRLLIIENGHSNGKRAVRQNKKQQNMKYEK